MEVNNLATWVYLGPERRHGERRRFRSLAQVLFPPAWELMVVPTLDISPAGIGFISPWNLPPDLPCDIRFRTPVIDKSVEIFTARGQVAHSVLSGPEGGFVIGLQFTDIPVDALAVIRTYVSLNPWPP